MAKLHVTRIKHTVKHQDSPPKNKGMGYSSARNLEMLEDVRKKTGVHTTLQRGLSLVMGHLSRFYGRYSSTNGCDILPLGNDGTQGPVIEMGHFKVKSWQ